MIRSIISFLCKSSPFWAVIILWRLQLHFWNPGGILAIIPIFFYSFVRPIPWFTPFAILFCFLIDYSCDTKLFWTTMYFITYAINGFQYFLDLQRADRNAIVPFMIFFGISLFVLMIINISWTMLFRCIWMFVWVSLLYIPVTNITKKVLGND